MGRVNRLLLGRINGFSEQTRDKVCDDICLYVIDENSINYQEGKKGILFEPY